MKTAFFVVFALTGFSALMLQVVWQRVISLHAGVDLVSFTTVVAAFLAGIGLGSLLGGALADRLGPRRSVAAFAISNALIAAFSFLSIWLFYDVYESVAPSLTSTAAKFGFNFALLLVPTTLMGLSLPLVSKGLVERIDDAGPLVGRLYSVNTIGAAAGAAVSGWILLGTFGFVATVRFAGTLNLVAALVAMSAYRAMQSNAAAQVRAGVDGPDGSDTEQAVALEEGEPASAGSGTGTGDRVDLMRWGIWPWYVIYGLTGAVALGFEVVFFRMIDSIMRSNSYSFAHVLSLYLLCFGVGAAIASRTVKRTQHPERWFLWLQFAVGVSALVGIIVFVLVLPRTPAGDILQRYLSTDGYSVGFRHSDGSARKDFFPIFFGVPMLVLGLPVLCMGASFPFVQSLVNRSMATLGRHTGMLLFSNVAGNVVGTLLVGFFAVDALGTSGTYRLLALLLLVPGLAAALLLASRSRAIGVAAAATVAMALLVVVFPANDALNANLQGVGTDRIHYAEDRTCANTLRTGKTGEELMTINGSSQNGYPFDDYHVLIGLMPALVHDQPKTSMALGLGIGATPYGLSLDPRIEHIDGVEICGPQLPLLHDLGERRSPELRGLFADPRLTMRVGDGRDFLLRSGRDFDVIVVDTLRQQSAFSGNLYSTDFYRLVRDHLAPGGVLAQWPPTQRTINSVLEVFPYVIEFNVASYHNSAFFLASMTPITFDRDEVVRRFDAVSASTGLDPAQRASIREYLASATPVCSYDPAHIRPATDDQLNSDLHPRDEYFLNNDPTSSPRATCVESGG